MKEIDAIAGEKHRRAATVEMALREFIDRHARKSKTDSAPKTKAVAQTKR